MQKKATLLIRIRVGKRYPFAEPVYSANGKLKPLCAMVDGRSEHHPEGTYHLRYHRKIHPSVGNQADEAIAALARKEIELRAAAMGMHIPADGQPVDANRRTIDAALKEYTAEILAQKDYSTYRAYARATRQFRESCLKKIYLDEINRADLLNFITFLRKLKSRRGKRLSDRTVRNRFVYVLFFLNANGAKGLVKKKDWPQYTERTPEEYTEQELQLLLNHADKEEKLVINTFLCSGFRHGELTHAHYADFDYTGSKVRVTEKPEWDWHPKKYQERTVPIPRWLTQQIAERRKSHPDDKLVFPNINGTPDGHILRVLKRVSKRAGFSGRVDDHKFRATAATRWSKAFAPQEVQYLLGHKDIQTTMRYLAVSNMDSTENRRKVEVTFSAFAPDMPTEPNRTAKIVEMAVGR